MYMNYFSVPLIFFKTYMKHDLQMLPGRERREGIIESIITEYFIFHIVLKFSWDCGKGKTKVTIFFFNTTVNEMASLLVSYKI